MKEEWLIFVSTIMNTFPLLLLTIAAGLPLLASPNEKPFVIPELREWTGDEGTLTLTPQSSIVLDKKSERELKAKASVFSRDIETMFGLKIPVRVGTPKSGDIFMTLGETSNKNNESYLLDIHDFITIKSPTPRGAFWGTRSILQILEQNKALTLPKGKTLDYPQYETRGFLLDVARKFFTIDFLRDYVKFMSYYKMNTFHIHLNDNGFRDMFDGDWDKTYAAFRLESSTYPGLTAKDGSYSKKEFINLQKQANAMGVEIIPEIDIPAHSLAFAHYMPEIGSKEYGMDHLDLFNPKTYTFAEKLFDEYITGKNPVFIGKKVHVGTDEYSNAKKEVVEKFRYFTDHFIKHVQKRGKEAVVWGALTHAKGETPVTSKDVTMYMWHNPYAQPKDMVEQGFKKMISIPDGLLYIVPAAGYYYDYLNTNHLYNSWEPRMIANAVFEKNDPMVEGGMFAVWNDHVGNGISQLDVHHRVYPAMQTMAAKTWTADGVTVAFAEFDTKRKQLGEGPGVNLLGNPGKTGIVLEKAKLAPGEKTGMLQIGYDYSVQFDLNAKQVKKGDTLFTSPHAVVYLADPKEGKLGFERDGYLSTFNFNVPTNKNVRIEIKGTNKSTALYVDGELIESLDTVRVPYGKGNATKAKVQTLVFPLEKAGKFKGSISNLKVNYKN